MAATITLVLFSCSKDIIDVDESIYDLTSETLNSTASLSGSSSTVAIYQDPDGPPQTFIEVPGASSKLTRKANGITVNFKTNGLIPGNAYTMWWVIFGDAPGPPILVTYAAGQVVGGSGNGNFSSHLSVGEIFNTPLTAEVHLAIRSHGPVQPEMMPDQIHSIDGGCQLPDIGFPSGPALYPDSDVVGYCANIQVAMHPRN